VSLSSVTKVQVTSKTLVPFTAILLAVSREIISDLQRLILVAAGKLQW
jgi:hypothetical protein